MDALANKQSEKGIRNGFFAHLLRIFDTGP